MPCCFFSSYQRSQDINHENDSYLLQNETTNTIIIDFGSSINLKNERNIVCKNYRHFKNNEWTSDVYF